MTNYRYERPNSALMGSGDNSKSSMDSRYRYSTVSVYGTDRIGRGSMLFSGPDGLRPYRMDVEDEHRYVGIGTMSQEGSSEVNYLWNSPKRTPHPRPRSALVGEIGWGVSYEPDFRSLSSGHQIKLRDFRQECEQRDTHKHFNQDLDVWYKGTRDIATPENNPYWIGSPSSANRCHGCSRRPTSSYNTRRTEKRTFDQHSTVSSNSQ